MDPNYWGTTGLKYTTQASNDSSNSSAVITGAGSNAVYSLDLLQLLERQRLGLAVNLIAQLPQQTNVLGHSSSSSVVATVGYPTTVLDSSGNSGLYTYTGGVLTNPQPAGLNSTLTYDNLLQHGILPDGQIIQSGHPSLQIIQHSADTNKLSSGHAKESSSLSAGYERRGMQGQDLGQQFSMLQSDSGSHIATHASQGTSMIGINPDLESRFLSLCDFIENQVGRQSNDNYLITGNQSGLRTETVVKQEPGRVLSHLPSAGITKSNQNLIKSFESSEMSASDLSRGVSGQNLAPELMQYVKSDAVDLSSMSRAVEPSEVREEEQQYVTATINTGDLVEGCQYSFITPDGRIVTVDGADQASITAAAQKGYMLIMPQQYGVMASGVKGYETASSSATVDLSQASTINFIDSLYSSGVEAHAQGDGGGIGMSYAAPQHMPAYSSVSNTSMNNSTGHSAGGSSGSGRKKAGESGVGIVLPMPQSREPDHSGNHSSTASAHGYGAAGGSARKQEHYTLGGNARQPEVSNKPISNSSKSSEMVDASQPIYLANINGNIYVNQYTMLQPGAAGSNAGTNEITLSTEDYGNLQEYGMTVHGPAGYQTIDPSSFTGVVDQSQYQTLSQQSQPLVKDGHASDSIAESVNSLISETISKSTMLLPGQDDREMGQLTGSTTMQGSKKSQQEQKNKAPVVTKSLMESSMNEIVTAVTAAATSSIQEPKTLASIKATKPSNAFENSFLKFLCGEKVETLASVVSSPIKNKPVLPKYVPEPRRPTQRHLYEKHSNKSESRTTDSVKTTLSSGVFTNKTSLSRTSDSVTVSANSSIVSSASSDSNSVTMATTTPSTEISSLPRKFPAKFSHKMHMRAQSLAQPTNTATTPVTKIPADSEIKKSAEASQGITTRRRSSEQSNLDSKKHNAQNVQWTVTSKKSKVQVKQSKGGLPVLVIKAVPSKDSK